MNQETFKKLRDWEEQCLIRHGFYIHAVMGTAYTPRTKEDPELLDVHTHGLLEKYNHPELQIVFPLGVLSPEVLHQIIHNAVDLIKEGKKLEEGKTYENVIQNYQVGILNSGNHRRIILPDDKGNLQSQKPTFAIQRRVNIS